MGRDCASGPPAKIGLKERPEPAPGLSEALARRLSDVADILRP